MIRKAHINEIQAIMSIIRHVVRDMQSRRIDQWDNTYPDKEVIMNDQAAGTLYVYEDDSCLKGVIVLNEDQPEEYRVVDWTFRSGKQLVIHRLCVSPQYQGQGIATQLMGFAEEYGRRAGYDSIRLDTFTKNSFACHLYEKLGYKKTGRVQFRKGNFYCFEKGLTVKQPLRRAPRL
ncbi:GNAT family N-acetyltransferase [Sporolactobacillus sp. Y61]|uniref:GNAT family N-acetyltransferase n=1 Tax=Sporolactobacillus sp. Y61 TaxID=3160863 RepID=A0AAU8IID2_9BACL